MQDFVQCHDFHPINLIPRRALRINGTDRGLNLVGSDTLFWQSLFQYRNTLLDFLAVPTFAVFTSDETVSD